jgi:hypothetical protein
MTRFTFLKNEWAGVYNSAAKAENLACESFQCIQQVVFNGEPFRMEVQNAFS